MDWTAPSWSAAQLAQANGIAPGLADYMLAHNAGLDSNPANQQFYQAAGFMNPAGSQTMLNQSGLDWLFNNDQTYGNINADAGQPNGPRLQYGMMGGTPYSYSAAAPGANQTAYQQWLNQISGGGSAAPPPGVTLYSQFATGAGAPASTAAGTASTAAPTTLGNVANGTASLGSGNGMSYAGGSPTFNEAGGAPGAGGANGMNIAPYAGNPYSLNIGNYLNPMMQYAMQQGDQSIMNSQAASGLVNSGDTLKQLYGYGMGMGAQNFNNAAQIAAGQQAFGAGLDQYDQNFAYNAQNNDRNFALQSLLGMGQLGLGGATQQGWNDRYLAQLLSGNLGALGQAQGAGAIGGSNAINNAISQMIANYLGGNALSGLTGGGGGTG